MSERKRRRGFAAMSPEQHREASRRGGIAANKNGSSKFKIGKEAAELGRKGGLKLSSNRKHMAEIGRKG